MRSSIDKSVRFQEEDSYIGGLYIRQPTKLRKERMKLLHRSTSFLENRKSDDFNGRVCYATTFFAEQIFTLDFGFWSV